MVLLPPKTGKNESKSFNKEKVHRLQDRQKERETLHHQQEKPKVQTTSRLIKQV